MGTVRNNVCFNRTDIETYKSACEIDRASRLAAEGALQQALESGTGISWYQEKPVAITAEVLALLAIVKVIFK